MDHLDDESLLARLPRRHDDEPPTLRQDLLDEVRDYLQSAWEEEQRQTPDPHEAWQLVLQRFGDPAKLVRKLWFDALKEQIMSRRLILAALGLAAVMFVAFAAINLRMLSALETTLAGAQQTNALLVEKLEALQAAPKATDDAAMTWRHLRLHLVAEDRSPVAGKVTIIGNPFRESAGRTQPVRDPLTREIGSDGRIDFGPIHIGSYSVEIQLNNGYAAHIPQVNLMPGEDHELSVICPVLLEPERKATLQFTPPLLKPSASHPEWKVPAPESLWLICGINDAGRRIGDLNWALPKSSRSPGYVVVMVNRQGEAFEVNLSEEGIQIFADNPDEIYVDKLRDRPWNGVLPTHRYSVTTELLQLADVEGNVKDPKFERTLFRMIPADAADLRSGPSGNIAGVDLASPVSVDSDTMTRNISVTSESVDGCLKLLSGGIGVPRELRGRLK